MSAAADGAKGEHSPFAQALLDHIEDSDITISDMVDSVRAEVDAKTHHSQMPWESSSLIGKFKFNPAPGNAVQAAEAERPSGQAATPVQPHGSASEAPAAASNGGRSEVQPKPSAPTGAGSAEAPSASKPDKTASLETSSGGSANSVLEPGDPLGEKDLKLAPADVKKVQLHLEIRRLYHGALNGNIDDASTRAAIIEWQKSEHLPPTSFLSQGQLAALLAISPVKPDSADLLKEMGTKVTQDALLLTSDEIKEVQLRLAAAGYLKSAPSGKFDPATSQAITRFQHDEGCVPSGSLGPLQLQELFAVTETRYEGSFDNASLGASQAPVERVPGVYHSRPQVQPQHYSHVRTNRGGGYGSSNGFGQMLNSFSSGFGSALGSRLFR